MMLVEQTTVATATLPVAQLKAHLRLGTGFAEDDVQDAVLVSFLRAALAAIEARTGKTLLERTFTYEWSAVPQTQRLDLPLAPVGEVTGIVVRDAQGVETPIDLSGLKLVADAQVPHVVPLAGDLPSIPTKGDLRVSFVAGFGPVWEDLPADLAQAVMLLAAHYYEFRNEVGLGAGCMPFGVNALIEQYRHIRLFGGRT